jgi:hypothetical protein
VKYRQQFNGDWVRPVRRGYKMRCCDCKLVHTVNFRVVKGQVQFQVFRSNRATAASRRTKLERQ